MNEWTPARKVGHDAASIRGLEKSTRQTATVLLRSRVLTAAAVAALVLNSLFWIMSGPAHALRFVAEPVFRGDLKVIVTATGSVQPTHTIEVPSKLSGIIGNVLVDHNAEYKKGDVLTELDTDWLEAAAESARVRLAAAQAKVTETEATVIERQRDFVLKRTLAEWNTSSQQDLEVARAADDQTGAAGKTPNSTSSKPGIETDTLSLGGQLYDNHWNVVGRQPPTQRQPVFPKTIKTYNAKTWRCSSCHGWDYLGRDGHLGEQSRSYTFKSLARVRAKPPEWIAKYIRSGFHRQMTAVLTEKHITALSLFLRTGQHSVEAFLDDKGRASGNSIEGKDLFEKTCASCHQKDGRAFIYGEKGDVASLGWLARNRPEQVLHKILNGVPKADMLSLRTVPDNQLASLFSYLQQLDPEAR
ncbi:MAG: c-type cytochrome [Pseudomonadota bacterium]